MLTNQIATFVFKYYCVRNAIHTVLRSQRVPDPHPFIESKILIVFTEPRFSHESELSQVLS